MALLIDETDLAHIWNKAATCMQELDSARLFITGGTGFFGCWLLESLRYAKTYLGLNTEFVVLTRNPEAFLKKMPHLSDVHGFQLLAGDVTNFVFPSGDFTHVIHAATETSEVSNQEQSMSMLDTTIIGTRHVLNFAAKSGVRKFLLVSSGAVYGVQPPNRSHIDETYIGSLDHLKIRSSYGLGKLVAEHSSLMYSEYYGFDVKIARCFAFVGPYIPMKKHFAIGNFINNVRQKLPIQIVGDGTPYRSYLYASDLIVWLWIILCQGKSGRVYNVGSEDAISMLDLAKLVAKLSQVDVDIVISQTASKHDLPARYVPHTQRAQSELNLSQWINLEESIHKTLRHAM